MAITVNGVEISDDAVAQEVVRLQADYERYVTENGGEPDDAQLREWAQENLIEKELLTQEALRSQEEPDARKVDLWLQENGAAFDETLCDADKRALCVKDLKIRALVKSVRKGVPPPSEEDLRTQYEANIARFTVPESIRLSHICRVPSAGFDRSQAYLELLTLKQRIDKHEIPWVEALQESDTYREDFGSFDTVVRGMLPLDLEEKLFALERGEVSDVMELTGIGSIHLFKILLRREPEVLPFEEVREDLVSLLFHEDAENALNSLIDKLKELADIRT
jgi:hypothetical protein